MSARLRVILLAACLAGASGCVSPDCSEVAPPALIPAPRSLTVADGCFEITGQTRLVAGPAAAATAALLAEDLRELTGLSLPVVDDTPGPRDIHLDAGGAAALVVGAGGAVLRGEGEALFHATRTLLQLVPAAAPWSLPAVQIEDAPRFAWRGAMLDVARHFFTKEEVMRLVDVLADYKINRLHLHLTDDQGWRIQIDSWPDLTRIGGETQVGGGAGGFYTQADYREIVVHAAARYVVVVPEIDMPGHINAALSAYPELNESGVAPPPYTGTSVGFSSLWMGAEVTERFVGDVLGEVAAMTPGRWLHVGGDEVPDGDPADYVAFVGMARAQVLALDKELVGWEEIGRAPVDRALAQYWDDPADALAATANGARIVSSPAENAYLDMKYDADSPVGGFWAGFTDLRDGYEWDPVPDGLTAESVEGVEGALWTEWVETEADLQFLMFPRILGHAELAWSETTEWDDYRVRLAAHGPRLSRRGIAFHPGAGVDWPRP